MGKQRGAPKFDMKLWPALRREFDRARGVMPLATWFKHLGSEEVRRLKVIDPKRFEESAED